MEEPTQPLVQKEKKHLVLIAILFMLVGAVLLTVTIRAGYIDSIMTNEQCNATVMNASEFAVNYGIEYTIAAITQKAIKCEEIPINYSNYSYTLIAVECLNLNQ